MKLSSLTQQDKIKLAAELDVDKPSLVFDHTGNFTLDYFVAGEQFMRRKGRYDTSYDAIIPLIQKQPSQVQDKIYNILQLEDSFYPFEKKADELLDALLVATGKCEQG